MNEIPNQSGLNRAYAKTLFRNNKNLLKKRLALFLTLLVEGKAPLWVVFWIIHFIPFCIALILRAVMIKERDTETAITISVLYFFYFFISAYFVFITAKKKERDWNKPYNDAFLHKAAIGFILLQILGTIVKMFYFDYN